MAGLSDGDKERTRYHLGYPTTTTVPTMAMGVPTARQPEFLLSRAMDNIQAIAIPRVLAQLQILDSIESQMVCAQKELAAEEVGSIKIRQDHIDQLAKEYARWSKRLADIFGVPLYPYSDKHAQGAGPRIRNARVS